MQGPMLKALRRFTQLLRVHIYVPGCCKYIRMTNGLQPLVELCMDGCFAGQTGLMHVRLLLTQHFLALAASLIGQCSTFHQTGRSNASIRTNLRRVFASLGPNNQDVDFSSARSTASCENSPPKSLVWFFYWSADTISICTPDQRRRQTQDLQNSCFT